MKSQDSFYIGMIESMTKMSYYKSHEDVIEEEAGRWKERSSALGEEGAMSQYKNRGTAGGAAVGGLSGALVGALAAAPLGAKGLLAGGAIGGLSGTALGAVLGRLIGGGTGKGERRLAQKLDSMNASQKKQYLSQLVRDRMAREQMANEMASHSLGRSQVNVYR